MNRCTSRKFLNDPFIINLVSVDKIRDFVSKMAASRRSLLEQNSPSQNEPGRELFEACRNGDLNKVKKLVSTHNVNAKDTAGRKSSPLHFAAGAC